MCFAFIPFFFRLVFLFSLSLLSLSFFISLASANKTVKTGTFRFILGYNVRYLYWCTRVAGRAHTTIALLLFAMPFKWFSLGSLASRLRRVVARQLDLWRLVCMHFSTRNVWLKWIWRRWPMAEKKEENKMIFSIEFNTHHYHSDTTFVFLLWMNASRSTLCALRRRGSKTREIEREGGWVPETMHNENGHRKNQTTNCHESDGSLRRECYIYFSASRCSVVHVRIVVDALAFRWTRMPFH